MEIKINAEYYGFKAAEFEFDGYEATVVIPKTKAENKPLILKTEYFKAFPETEIALVEKGYYLAYVDNENRWGTEKDLKRKADFVNFVSKEFGLNGKCVPVGMSCGGIFAIKLASMYPELVSCIYIDAPVVNYMSCPCGFGNGRALNPNNDEILNALNLDGIEELLAYRDMPLDHIPNLIKNEIPTVLVAGDSDTCVPYKENGAFVTKAYSKTEIPFEVYVKPGCDHHPHGLEDPSPVVEFIEKYGK